MQLTHFSNYKTNRSNREFVLLTKYKVQYTLFQFVEILFRLKNLVLSSCWRGRCGFLIEAFYPLGVRFFEIYGLYNLLESKHTRLLDFVLPYSILPRGIAKLIIALLSIPHISCSTPTFDYSNQLCNNGFKSCSCACMGKQTTAFLLTNWCILQNNAFTVTAIILNIYYGNNIGFGIIFGKLVYLALRTV